MATGSIDREDAVTEGEENAVTLLLCFSVALRFLCFCS
jgi:hypothetical protein